MDDIIISGNDALGSCDLKSYLIRAFRMKDLGELTYFLGLEIIRTNLGIHIHQKKYVVDLVSVAFRIIKCLIPLWSLISRFKKMLAAHYLIPWCVSMSCW